MHAARLRRTRVVGALTLAAAILPAFLFADTPAPLDAPAGSMPNAVRVNGALRDEMWDSVPATADFVQREPHEGAPPSQRTEFRVAYDATTMYVKVVAFDTEPNKIVGYLTRRDASSPSWRRIRPKRSWSRDPPMRSPSFPCWWTRRPSLPSRSSHMSRAAKDGNHPFRRSP